MPAQIHLCILSGQALPNLLPLCLYRPQRIVLAVSADMPHRIQPMIATLLKAELISRAEDVISLPDMPDSDYSAMLQWSRQQIGLLRQYLPDHQIVLNATGGTKLMSQALAVACQEQAGSAVLYCDTIHERIEWLAPQLQCEPLPTSLLDSATIFKANGIEVVSCLSDQDDWRERVQTRSELTRWIAAHAAGDLGSFIPALNNVLHELKPEQLPATVQFKQPARSNHWRDALRRLEKAGLLQLAEPLIPTAPPKLVVDQADALQYLSGGWLEEYLWLCMREARMNDVHCAQHINAELGSDEGRLNELDLVVGHRNRVLVVECKTADLTRPGAYTRMIDKLDSLGKRTGGLLTQCWLICVRWPHDDEERQQQLRLIARDRNITLVEPRHLADLPQRIQSWKTSLKLPLN